MSSNPVAAEADARYQPAEMRAFSADAGLYQVYSNYGRVGKIDVATGSYETMTHRAGEKVNAAGFRTSDLFAYGIVTQSTTLGRIDADGQLERLGAIEGLPTDQGTYYVGDFAGDLLYVRNSRELTKLYGIDVDSMSVADVIETDQAMSNIYDIAFNQVDKKFYASRRGAENTLISIDLDGKVQTIGDNGLQKLTFGGMYADSEGSIFGVANQTGGVYRFNVDTGEATWVANGPASGVNDGFSNAEAVLELPPTAVDDAFEALSVEDVAGNVFANNGSGADVDGNQDELKVVGVEGLADAVGQTIGLSSGAQLVVDADGSFEYSSNGVFDDLPSGQTQTDSFEYTIADESGLTSVGTVTLTFEGVARSSDFDGAKVRGLDAYGIPNSQVKLTNVGDFNGDGFDDAMVSSDDAFNGAGITFLIYGNENGIDETLDVQSLFPNNGGDGTLGSVFLGAKVNDRAGKAIASIGDVNGDGFEDVAISALDADPNGVKNAGSVYVIYGQQTPLNPMLDLANIGEGINGFVVNGSTAHDLIGQTVVGLGDFNEDGMNDFAISAPHADVNGTENVGQTYVVYGTKMQQSSIDVRELMSSESLGFALNGTNAHDLSGGTIDGGVDLNGDAIPDLLITATYADADGLVDSGQSYVVFGGRDAFPNEFELSSLIKGNGGDGSRGITIDGSKRKSGEGSDVRIIADQDNDGVNELSTQSSVFSLKENDQTQIRSVSFRETLVYADNFDDGEDLDGRTWDQYVYSATLHSTEGTQVTIWGDPHVVITIDGVTERFDIGYGAGEIELDSVTVRWASEAYDESQPDRQLPLKTFSIDAAGTDNDLNVSTYDGVNVVDHLTTISDSDLRDLAIELRRYAGSAKDPLARN